MIRVLRSKVQKKVAKYKRGRRTTRKNNIWSHLWGEPCTARPPRRFCPDFPPIFPAVLGHHETRDAVFHAGDQRNGDAKEKIEPKEQNRDFRPLDFLSILLWRLSILLFVPPKSRPSSRSRRTNGPAFGPKCEIGESKSKIVSKIERILVSSHFWASKDA